MPYYTEAYDFSITLPNDIRDGAPNPFIDGYSNFPGTLSVKSLGVPTKLPTGEGENYKGQFYKNIYSAQTTAGYTGLSQSTFYKGTGVMSGYQNLGGGLP